MEVEVRLSLWNDITPERYLVSDQLQVVLGIKEESRARIVAALWQYIKQNRLQDTDDRGFINLNSELQAIFGGEEKIKFHQIMGLIKPHLTEVPPVELSVVVKSGAERQRKFYTMPVLVHSETFRKALQFLIDHNYEFEGANENQQSQK